MNDWLKNPKNSVAWLISGYVLALGGYALYGRYDDAGKIIGFVGTLVLAVTLLRLSLSRAVLGIIIAAAVLGYGWWYSKSVTIDKFEQTQVYEHEPWKKYVYTRHRPKYAQSGIGETAQKAIFAPAFMADSVVCFPRWRMTTTQTDNLDYKPAK